MRLATTTADLLSYCATPAEAVKAFSGTGFRHLDYSFYRCAKPGSAFLSDNWMEEIEEAAKAAEQTGADFVQAHSPGNNFLNPKEDYETVVLANIRSIEACGVLGIGNIVVHSGSAREFLYPGDRQGYFEKNRLFYERLYPAMEKYNVRVLIENSADANTGGQYFFMTGEEMSDFIDFCGHPLLGACWDVGHANLQNPAQYGDIVRLGDKLKAVHIQDNYGQHDDHTAPFMGTLDIDSVMRGLADNGFIGRGGVFTFECDNILLRSSSWPNYRNAVPGTEGRLLHPTLELRRESLRLLYSIGKTILEAYGCYEE